MCIVQNGPDFIFKEGPFGGYRVRVNFKTSFWNASGSAWRHDDLLDDFYAMAPGSSTPISTGPVNRLILFYPSFMQYVVVIESVPNDKHHAFCAWPFAPENAGLPNPPPDVPSRFFTDLDHPGMILPPVYC